MTKRLAAAGWSGVLPAMVLALSACTSVPRDAGFSTLEKTMKERSAYELQWSALRPDFATNEVRSLLDRPLTADDAVQVGLMNNRFLQAKFDELGIARANLIEAGVFPNPTLEGRVRWAHDTSKTEPELALLFDVTDLVRRGKRAGVAQAELDRTILEVGDALLKFAADVRRAYFDLQATEHMRRMRQEVFSAAEAAAQLDERQRAAGNISALELAIAQSAFEETRLELVRSEADARLDRQELARAMGLTSADTSWSVVGELPGIPSADPPIEEMETRALAGRLDLKAAKTDIEASRRDLSYRKWFFVPSLQIGVDAERDFDHGWTAGPIVQLSLPLFDRGQGGVARAKSRILQADHVAAALENDIRHDVRVAWDRLGTARNVVEMYRGSVIPTREKVVAESQRHYNFMLVGPMTLLQAKRDEIDAYRGYIVAVRDYWTARSDLERAVGTRLTPAE